MAAELDHIDLANRNHDTLVYLVRSGDAHSEWVATIAFYKAVQVVEAVFITHLKKHSHGHDDRIADLKRPIFTGLFTSFRPLYAASLVARYLEDFSSRKCDAIPSRAMRYTSFSQYMPANSVVTRLLKKRLQPLEQNALQFLSSEGRSNLKRIETDT